MYLKSVDDFDHNVLESESVWLVSIASSSLETQRLEEVYRGIFKVGYIERTLYTEVSQVGKTACKNITLESEFLLNQHSICDAT